MAKKKKAPYTLAGFWKNINTIAPKCFKGTAKEKKESLLSLADAVDEVNASSIPGSIGYLFVRPYLESEKFSVVFTCPDKFPEEGFSPPVSCNTEITPSKIMIDAFALYKYVDSFREALETTGGDEESIVDFRERRQTAFMKQILKLPEPYFIYLAVLQELAYCNNVVSVEDREGNFHKSDAGFYLSLLWAFKEFETFYLRAQNRNLRADYGIIWHEGEWVQDSKRSRGYI